MKSLQLPPTCMQALLEEWKEVTNGSESDDMIRHAYRMNFDDPVSGN